MVSPVEDRQDLVRFRWMKRLIRLPRLALVVAMLIDAGISVFWLADFEAEATDGRSSEANDWQILIKPLTWGLSGVVLAFTTLFLCLIPMKRTSSPNILLACLLLKFLALLIDSVNISFPNTAHYVLGVLWIILHISEILHLLFIIVCFALYARRRPMRDSIFDERDRPRDKAAFEAFFDDLESWLSLREDRKVMGKRTRDGLVYFTIICCLMLLLCYSNFAIEMIKMYTKESPFFTPDELKFVGEPEHSYPNTPQIGNHNFTNENRSRVFYIVIDGLRVDYARKNDAFRAFFFENSTFLRDSKYFLSRCELPSMSVPNWVTLLTGAPPEMHGTFGNLLIPETGFDSIFREAKRLHLMRGMTGSPWFCDIVKEQIPFLDGDGTLDTGEDPNDEDWKIGHKTAAPADRIRGRLLREAATSPLDYRLFLAHFSDVDMQGHYYGVSKSHNKYNSYYDAITEKTDLIKRFLDLVDENTVVFITSDHGQVDAGGHGGVAEVLREVPLFIYKKNSNYGQAVYNGSRFSGHRPVRNMDIPASICAILGVPVPRHCNGRLIDDVMPLIPEEHRDLHYIDLFYQKRTYVWEYLKKTKASSHRTSNSLFEDSTAGWTRAEFVHGVEELMDAWDSQRSKRLQVELARNVCLSLLVVPSLFLIVLGVLQHGTACDITVVLAPWRWNIRKWQNARAFLISQAVTFWFYIINICVFLIIYRIRGYKRWDSTMVHEPMVVVEYIFITVVPAALLTVVYLRAYQLPLSRRPRFLWRDMKNNPITPITSFLYQFWTNTIIGTNDSVRNLPMLYLYKHYNLLHAVGSLLFMFIIQAMYTFILPEIWRIHYVTKENWETRFRIFTCEIFAIPWCIGHILMMFIWPSFSPAKSNWDAVYVMLLRKTRHRKISVPKIGGGAQPLGKGEDDEDDDAGAPPPSPGTRAVMNFWRIGEERKAKRFRNIGSIEDLLSTAENEYEEGHFQRLADVVESSEMTESAGGGPAEDGEEEGAVDGEASVRVLHREDPDVDAIFAGGARVDQERAGSDGADVERGGMILDLSSGGALAPAEAADSLSAPLVETGGAAQHDEDERAALL